MMIPLLAICLSSTAILSAQEPALVEYSVPTPNASLNDIAPAADGSLWFVETLARKIGRIITSGTITEYPIAAPFVPPLRLAQGPDGNVWVADSAHIGKITTTGAIILVYSVSGTVPLTGIGGITTGPDGNLWFTAAQTVSKMTLDGKVTDYPIYSVPFCCPQGGDIVAGSDGNLWFTAADGPGSNLPSILKMTTQGTIVGQYAASFGGRLSLAPDGNIWFSCWSSICRITPTGVTTEFPAVDVGEMTAGPDGNLWYGEFSLNKIVRITPDGVTTEYPLPGIPGGSPSIPPQSSLPVGIAQGTDGSIWFTEQASNKIGKFPLIPPPAPNLAPTLVDQTVANGATYNPGGLVPGSWAIVKGSNLSDVARTWSEPDFSGLGNALPTNVSGTSVLVNGLSAAVYYVDPHQVTFQVPAGTPAAASVQVFRNGQPSNTVTGSLQLAAPGIFPVIVGAKIYPAGVFLDGSFVGDPSIGAVFRRAKPGDVIQAFGTGLAPSPSGIQVPVQSIAGVMVTIGAITIPADAVALVGPGEFQINFTVPPQFANLAEGEYPISIRSLGIPSSTVNAHIPGVGAGCPFTCMVVPIQH